MSGYILCDINLPQGFEKYTPNAENKEQLSESWKSPIGIFYTEQNIFLGAKKENNLIKWNIAKGPMANLISYCVVSQVETIKYNIPEMKERLNQITNYKDLEELLLECTNITINRFNVISDLFIHENEPPKLKTNLFSTNCCVS